MNGELWHPHSDGRCFLIGFLALFALLIVHDMIWIWAILAALGLLGAFGVKVLILFWPSFKGGLG